MVRHGHILSAPHFVTESGPGSEIDPKLVKAWTRFDLAGALSEAIGKPTRVANDADVQGLAVVAGKGLELVLTLGTGFGTGVFFDGHLLPHLELAHQPFRKGETYNDQLGERTRKEIGDHRWNRRVRKAAAQLDELFFFDHLYLGGGNARRVVRDDLGELLDRTTVVDNSAGILGGIKLWTGRPSRPVGPRRPSTDGAGLCSGWGSADAARMAPAARVGLSGTVSRTGYHGVFRGAASVRALSRWPTRTVGPDARPALVAQRTRASDYGSEGWGFESLRARRVSPVQSHKVAELAIRPSAPATPAPLFLHGGIALPESSDGRRRLAMCGHIWFRDGQGRGLQIEEQPGQSCRLENRQLGQAVRRRMRSKDCRAIRCMSWRRSPAG